MIELHTLKMKLFVSGVLSSCSSAHDNLFLKKVEPYAGKLCPKALCATHNVVKLLMKRDQITNWKDTETGMASAKFAKAMNLIMPRTTVPKNIKFNDDETDLVSNQSCE